MLVPPTLRTPRLTLRPFTAADAPDVQRLAGDFAIADTTLLIPHPYENGVADAWIATHGTAYARGESITYAITLGGTTLLGTVGMRLVPQHQHAEIGYWIGRPYWGRGYATEAACELIRYGFETLGLHRIYAYHFARNPASGRVLHKAGMRREGLLRGHVRRWDRFEDLEAYAIMRQDYDEGQHI